MRVCHKDTSSFSFLHDILHHDVSSSDVSSSDVSSLDVSSSDFTDESEGILAYRITHGFSQNFGRWPMARARYMLLLFFVTQISQITQIFLRGRVLSHRFHRLSQILYEISGESLFPLSGGICNDRTGRIRENP